MPSPHTPADLHPLLARIAAQPGDATALIVEGETLSYGALWAAADARAEELRAAGMRPGDRIALVGARTAARFVDLLAVLIAGGIYLPLAETAPEERKRGIIDRAEARLILSDEGIAVRDVPAQDLPPGYLLFTSGSTGVPKGVRVTLDNLDAYIGNLRGAYPVGASDRVAQIADLAFDASVHEIFGAWATGAALCVVPARHALMWPRYFRDLGITDALLIPSQIRLALRGLKPGMLPALRQAFLGAELVTGAVVRALREAAPNVACINLWGPTEGTVALTHHPIAEVPAEEDGAPIGRPWPGHDLRLVEDEMWVAGPQICAGYWQAPEEEARRFEERDGLRFYRSGDLARVDAAGDLHFVGRADRQVKIKGHRIELEEVERAIGGEVGVIAVDGQLVAFVAQEIDLAALRERVPAYMVPARVVVGALPRTVSGKVDLKALVAIAG